MYNEFKKLSKTMKILIFACLYSWLVCLGFMFYSYDDLKTKFEQKGVQIERLQSELQEVNNQIARIQGE